MIHVISVEPFGDGWAVRTNQVANQMIFRSGRSAETAAKRLAAKLKSVGEATEVHIHLRDGQIVSCPGEISD